MDNVKRQGTLFKGDYPQIKQSLRIKGSAEYALAHACPCHLIQNFRTWCFSGTIQNQIPIVSGAMS